ncbi:MAG: dihydrodipicolinate synthase family protein [Oscillospiraceae bacterium]
MWSRRPGRYFGLTKRQSGKERDSMSKICSLARYFRPQLTPFREDGSINYGEYTRLTQFITDAGVHGVFVCGTTGEFVNLTLEERKRLLTAAVEERGRRAVFCSTPRP